MVKKWTREERKKHLDERRYGYREKILTLAGIAFIIGLLLYAIYYFLSIRADPAIVFGLIITTFIVIVVGVFIVDQVFIESW